MLNIVHKIVMFCATPLTLGLVLLLAGIVVAVRRQWKDLPSGRLGVALMSVALAWLWLWSTPLMTRMIGLPLERLYPSQLAETMPDADAILLLGGGMGANTNAVPYAEMWSPADRVWHAARLFKAERAPKITLSGGGVKETTVPLLKDFGVPEEALVYFEDAKNTEDEARMIAEYFKNEGVQNPKLLLVTSAWHMRRAEWLFRRAGLDVVPAATDYESTVRFEDEPIHFTDFLPDACSLFGNACLFKEHFAYWCYRLLK